MVFFRLFNVMAGGCFIIALPTLQGMFAAQAEHRPAKHRGSLEETIAAAASADDGKPGWCWAVGVARHPRCSDWLQRPKGQRRWNYAGIWSIEETPYNYNNHHNNPRGSNLSTSRQHNEL